MLKFDQYYMLVALSVRERANCLGRKVGAVFVRNNRIVSAGYNGTPEGMTNCEEGGCIRCKKHRQAGEWYDKCICVHAEQNAMVTAARFGNIIENAVVYSTLQPCFSCLKEMLQLKIKTIYYVEELSQKEPKDDKEKDFIEQYNILLNRFEKIPTKIDSLDLTGITNMKKYLLSLK